MNCIIEIDNNSFTLAFYPGGKQIDLQVEDTLEYKNISALINKELASRLLAKPTSCQFIAHWRGRDWIIGRPSTLFEGEHLQWSIDLQVM